MLRSFNVYQQCIATCLKCAAICNYCATACLEQDDANQMARGIQLSRECAYICNVTAQVMSMGGMSIQSMCEICEVVCNACNEECFKFNKEHCAECADICRRVAIECRSVIGKLSFTNRAS